MIQTPTNKSYVLTDLNTGEVYVDDKTDKELCFEANRGDDAYNALVEYLETHPQFVKEFSIMINKYLSKAKINVDLIDENIINDLMTQENSICNDVMTPAESLSADGVEDE